MTLSSTNRQPARVIILRKGPDPAREARTDMKLVLRKAFKKPALFDPTKVKLATDPRPRQGVRWRLDTYHDEIARLGEMHDVMGDHPHVQRGVAALRAAVDQDHKGGGMTAKEHASVHGAISRRFPQFAKGSEADYVKEIPAKDLSEHGAVRWGLFRWPEGHHTVASFRLPYIHDEKGPRLVFHHRGRGSVTSEARRRGLPVQTGWPARVSKSRRLSWRTEFQGLPISIETAAGEERRWDDPHDGSSGRTVMAHHYGYIRGTLGLDGDAVDCFIGPREDAPFAYVVTQMKAPEFKVPDEHKVMLGFGTPEEAKRAYRKHYSDERFFGWMDAAPVSELLGKLRARRKMLGLKKLAEEPGSPLRQTVTPVLRSLVVKGRVKAHERREPSGKLVLVHEHERRERQRLLPGDPHPTLGLPPSLPGQRAEAVVRGVKVPPMSWGLTISTDPAAKIQATWYDAKGRKQYAYHPDWVAARSAAKFESVERMHGLVTALRQRVSGDLGKPDANPGRVAAAVVRLLDAGRLRVGSERFAQENGSFGASSLRRRHVSLGPGGAVTVSFVGKHGQAQAKTLDDPSLHAALEHLLGLPGDRVFQYRRPDGSLAPMTEREIRGYLAPFGIVPKHFRTYHATLLAAEKLSAYAAPASAAEAKRTIAKVVKEVAMDLGHTPAVSRSHYINPAVLSAYSAGRLLAGGVAKSEDEDAAAISDLLRRLRTLLEEGLIADADPFPEDRDDSVEDDEDWT